MFWQLTAKSKSYKLLSRKNVIEQSVPHPCEPNRLYSSSLILSTSLNVFVTIGLTNMMLSEALFSLLLKILLTLIYQKLYRACFEDIRNQYRLEHYSTLNRHINWLQKCAGLPILKGNVNLALAVFRESTNATLRLNKQLQGAAIITQTHEFQDVIIRILHPKQYLVSDNLV